MVYFPTPFDFDQVMQYLGNRPPGYQAYQYSYTSVPTDAASYAANVTWLDTRPQPTWDYIRTGAGWALYDYYYQHNYPIVSAVAEPVVDAIAAMSGSSAPRLASVVTRPLNTAFKVSSTRDSLVNYSVQIASSLSLTTGQTGSASLVISADGVSYSEIARFVNGNTGTLAVGLNLAQTVCGQLCGEVPANNYVKLVTSGAGAVSYIVGQETLL